MRLLGFGLLLWVYLACAPPAEQESAEKIRCFQCDKEAKLKCAGCQSYYFCSEACFERLVYKHQRICAILTIARRRAQG